VAKDLESHERSSDAEASGEPGAKVFREVKIIRDRRKVNAGYERARFFPGTLYVNHSYRRRSVSLQVLRARIHVSKYLMYSQLTFSDPR